MLWSEGSHPIKAYRQHVGWAPLLQGSLYIEAPACSAQHKLQRPELSPYWPVHNNKGNCIYIRISGYTVQRGIVLFLSDFIVPPNVTYDMANVIVDWMKKNNSKELITFNSMVVPQKNGGVAGAANSKEALQRLADIDLPILPFGNLGGLSGTLLTKTASKNIPASCLFGQVLNQYPDPRAAASVVNVLNTMLDIQVNADPLIKEAEEIEARLKELAKHVQGEPETPIYM